MMIQDRDCGDENDAKYLGVIIEPDGDTSAFDLAAPTPHLRSFYDMEWYAEAVHIDPATLTIWYEHKPMT